MPFPSRVQLCDALLVYIRKNGGPNYAVIAADAYEPLAAHFQLTSEERNASRNELYKDGRPEPAWHGEVQYARRNLLKRGLLSSDAGRGLWMLTPQGLEAAERVESRKP